MSEARAAAPPQSGAPSPQRGAHVRATAAGAEGALLAGHRFVRSEAGFAYKDLGAVVDVLHRLDISRKVVSLKPMGNIKG